VEGGQEHRLQFRENGDKKFLKKGDYGGPERRLTVKTCADDTVLMYTAKEEKLLTSYFVTFHSKGMK
jgi:hypothetical protein